MSTVTIPRSDIRLIDATGVATRDMYRWMTDVTKRIGGTSGPGSNDLSAAGFDDAGIEEARAQLFTLENAAGVVPVPAPIEVEGDTSALLAQLMAEVHDLRRQVEDLKAGTVI